MMWWYRVRSDAPRVCPRTGRHPLRRKKNCALFAVGALLIFGLFKIIDDPAGFSPLHPLDDAESEAQRLLKFITNYHYLCNVTFQLGNQSHWPICTDHEAGLDLESHKRGTVYTVGWHGDFAVERVLASNYSFNVQIISPKPLPAMSAVNNTHVQEVVLVPNDYADFSRNSYGQSTLNSVMERLDHKQIELIRLAETVQSVHLWELLHFVIADGLLRHVKQLHLVVVIDKLDEDELYHWYRTLHQLFYRAGFRLYHTASSDSLCLQVTMMESCVYYLSWVRHPSPTTFVLHPPAGAGKAAQEEQRLLSYINELQTDCSQQTLGMSSVSTSLKFAPIGTALSYPVCTEGAYHIFPASCTAIRFRWSEENIVERQLQEDGCKVYTLLPQGPHRDFITSFQVKGVTQPPKYVQNRGHWTWEEVLQWLSSHGHVSLVEIDAEGSEWDILAHLLDTGFLQNVTQLITEVQLPDSERGSYPPVLRRRYSELRRIEAQGLALFHQSASDRWTVRPHHSRLTQPCCFLLGFTRKEGER